MRRILLALGRTAVQAVMVLFAVMSAGSGDPRANAPLLPPPPDRRP